MTVEKTVQIFGNFQMRLVAQGRVMDELHKFELILW